MILSRSRSMGGNVKRLLGPWLTERGLSQQQLAKRLGISPQRLCLVLSNRTLPSGTTPTFNPVLCRQTTEIMGLSAAEARSLHLAAAADKGYEVLP